MRGVRISPRVVRNQPVTARQLRQGLFLRSTVHLTQEVRANMRELSARHIRELRSAATPHPIVPRSTAAHVLEQMADLLGDLMEARESRDAIAQASKASSPARRQQYGMLADSLGHPRDADGNVIHLDRQDRPYVYVNGSEIVYVKVYQARITPKGHTVDAMCTVSSPDGRQEVLLVEPVESWVPGL